MATTGGQTLVICQRDEVSELERWKQLCLEYQVMSSQSTGTRGPTVQQARLGEPGSPLLSGRPSSFPTTHGPKALSTKHKAINIFQHQNTFLPTVLQCLGELHNSVYKVSSVPMVYKEPLEENILSFFMCRYTSFFLSCDRNTTKIFTVKGRSFVVSIAPLRNIQTSANLASQRSIRLQKVSCQETVKHIAPVKTLFVVLFPLQFYTPGNKMKTDFLKSAKLFLYLFLHLL